MPERNEREPIEDVAVAHVVAAAEDTCRTRARDARLIAHAIRNFQIIEGADDVGHYAKVEGEFKDLPWKRPEHEASPIHWAGERMKNHAYYEAIAEAKGEPIASDWAIALPYFEGWAPKYDKQADQFGDWAEALYCNPPAPEVLAELGLKELTPETMVDLGKNILSQESFVRDLDRVLNDVKNDPRFFSEEGIRDELIGVMRAWVRDNCGDAEAYKEYMKMTADVTKTLDDLRRYTEECLQRHVIRKQSAINNIKELFKPM